MVLKVAPLLRRVNEIYSIIIKNRHGLQSKHKKFLLKGEKVSNGTENYLL